MGGLADGFDIDAAAWLAWREAAARLAIDAELRELYAALDADIAARGPTCWQSGKCCNFGGYGHRLYVTALEVVWFLGQVHGPAGESGTLPRPLPGGGEKAVALPQASERDVCPYQIDKACSTHTVRPLGCRIFFCQAGTETWQQDLYERYLAELRDLHERHNVAYRYADWMALLDEVKRT